MNPPSRLVSIHQPNFFPWLGYFGKIIQSDVFVFLDNVQIPRTGAGSWVNRVHILNSGQVQWLTLPIDKAFPGLRAINEVDIVADDRWRRKITDSLRQNYKKAPYFDQVFPVLDPLLNSTERNLAQYNIAAITTIAQEFGVPSFRFVCSSALPIKGLVSTDRLVRIVQEVGGTHYLYGGAANAAGGYQENEKFVAAGLAPIAQEFRHPVYPQFNASVFQPGLSVIDALMNIGFNAFWDVLKTHQSHSPSPERSQ